MMMQPTEGSFHHPAAYAQAATVGQAALGDPGFDFAVAQQDLMKRRMIGPVCIKAFGQSNRRARSAADVRYRVHQRDQLRDIVPVGSRQSTSQGDALGIGNHMVLAALFPAIRGFPPFTARMEEL